MNTSLLYKDSIYIYKSKYFYYFIYFYKHFVVYLYIKLEDIELNRYPLFFAFLINPEQ